MIADGARSVTLLTGTLLSTEVLADWSGTKDRLGKEHSEGFMLDTELAGPVFERESDEDLEFLGRKP